MLKSGKKLLQHSESQNGYYSLFTKSFSPIVINNLIQTGKSAYLTDIVRNSDLLKNESLDMTLGEFYDFLYSKLEKSYRSEYIYKNAIANKILLGVHSLNTSYMLTEFRAVVERMAARAGWRTIDRLREQFFATSGIPWRQIVKFVWQIGGRTGGQQHDHEQKQTAHHRFVQSVFG